MTEQIYRFRICPTCRLPNGWHSPECHDYNKPAIQIGLEREISTLRLALLQERERCAIACEEIGKEIVCPEECTAVIRDLPDPCDLIAARQMVWDAARYRWLRDVGDSTWTPLQMRFVRGGLPANRVDAAIDAAMKEGKTITPAVAPRS